MGSYYTYLNQQRLTGAEKSSFLVWFEGQNEALAIGPAMPGGTQSVQSHRPEATACLDQLMCGVVWAGAPARRFDFELALPALEPKSTSKAAGEGARPTESSLTSTTQLRQRLEA